jgi:TusA-related sulfurtransferase
MNTPIDCMGTICPVPTVKAQIQYKKMEIGDSVTIISDHSCTAQNLKDAFKKYNCKVEVREEIDGIWEVTITKL